MQVEALASACNFGGYLSIFSGLVYDALGHRHGLGPRVTLLIGTVCNLTGFLGLWAAATGRIPGPFWLLVVLALIGCNGGTWTDTAVMVTSVRNFPNERGTVVGILKSCVGRRFLLAYGVMFSLALYQTGTSLAAASPRIDISQKVRMWLSIGSLAIISLVLWVPLGTGGLLARPAELPTDEERHSAIRTRLLGGNEAANGSPHEPAEATPAGKEQAASGSRAPPSQPAAAITAAGARPELSLWQCLGNLDYWCLFMACLIGMGSGLVFLNNLAQLVPSLGGAPNSQDVFVSLFSVCNCVGRLVLGYVPERLLHAYGTPRPIFMVALGLLSATVMAFNAYATLDELLPASILAGFAFGAHWSVMATLTSELFGLRSFASNYCLVQLAPAFGGFGLSRLAGQLYERQSKAQGHTGKICDGKQCYRQATLDLHIQQTFLIVASLDLLAAAISMVLYLRTRVTYTAIFQQLHQLDGQFEGSAHGLTRAHEQMHPVEPPEQLHPGLQNALASHPVQLRLGTAAAWGQRQRGPRLPTVWLQGLC
eukprot:jgi/Astpho2/1572/fgenesh1_pg.00026_%23_48_t